MPKKDYYDILGINKKSSPEEIKKAYRTLAMKHHPDRNQGDKTAESKFKEASEAYQVLSDPKKKSSYDQFGHSAFEGGGGAGGFDFGGFESGAFSDIFDDFFGDFMGSSRGGGRSKKSRSNRGSDLKINLEVSLEEAYFGKKQTINLSSNEKCEKCSGSGAEPGSKPKNVQHVMVMEKLEHNKAFLHFNKLALTAEEMGKCYQTHVKIVEALVQ